MNLIRSVMSLFLLALIGLAVSGWIWAGRGLKPELLAGGRFVLATSGLASAGAMWLLWRFKQPDAS